MQNLFVIESRGQRVLTSAQIAECYGTTVDCIKQNFHANKIRFVEGKHYIALVGNELKEFKNKVRIPHPVESEMENEVRIPYSAEIKAKYQFDTQFKYAKSLYLWTEKGALLHAKSLNTDKAWEVYDYLVDFYFRAKEKQEPEPPVPQTYREKREAALAEIHSKEVKKPLTRQVVNVPDDPNAQKMIQEIKKALGAVEVMLDESNRHIGKEAFKEYRVGMANAFQALMLRITVYLKLEPKMIEKPY